MTRIISRTPDLLYGMQAIADHLAPLTYRQVQHLHETKAIPTFRMGSTVCARRSTLARHFGAQEQAAARDAPGPRRRVQGVIRGLPAIARHLGVEERHLASMIADRHVPTYLSVDGEERAFVAELDAYLARERGR